MHATDEFWPVAERGQYRCWSCAWLHDGGDASSAEGNPERGWALGGEGGITKEASDIQAQVEERSLNARPPWPIRRLA
jgi:hypothetical protein